MIVNQHGGVKGETRVVERFVADDLGAPFEVVLHNSVRETVNSQTGAVLDYRIPDLEGLIRAIVITRILHPRKLFGADIKFIRKALELKQKELAGHIEVTAEHLCRCENGSLPLSPSAEKLLRVFALKTAIKLHKLKTCEAKSKLEEALDKLFDAIKPVAAFDVEEPLELHFHRSKPSVTGHSDGCDDEGEWDADVPEAA